MKYKNEILAALMGVAGVNNVDANTIVGGEKNTDENKNKIGVGITKDYKDEKNFLAFNATSSGEIKNVSEAPASAIKSGFEKSDAREAEVILEANTRFTQLDLTSFFETDMAVIPEASKAQIESKFRDLLSQVTQENRNDYLLADWNVLVFSDPRKTYKWEGGNTGLSLERGKQLVAFLKVILNSYEFKGLTPRIEQAMHDKEINIIMPNTGEEEGVMYPEELINPDTNLKYTKEEIQKIQKDNPSLYKELLSLCRGVYFTVNLDNTEDIDIINPRTPNFPVTPENPSIKEVPGPRIPINPIEPRVPHIKAPHYHYWPSWMTKIVQGRGLVKHNKHFKCHIGGR
ncbi:MAG: hypothetical protein WCW65_02060 [Candidatus Paceibacterota bacterium]